MNESSDGTKGKEVKYVFWRVKNPSDEEGDDGTHVGGWIRDQIRANIEKAAGIPMSAFDLMRRQKKDGK